MAGLYQEGQRFPMYEEGKRFQIGPRPPMTLADYLRILEARKRTSAMPEGIPAGLEPANVPTSNETIWKGKGLYGEPAFTNIPERAQAMGLRETMPPVSGGGYIETMPTGKTFAVEAPQAQAGGQGRSYAEKVKARQKLEAHILEKGIPMAEAIKLQEFWGVDNDSLEKAQKAEVQIVKESKAPETIETVEGVFQWNPQTSRFDIPLGKGKESIKEIRELAKEEKTTKKEEARLQMAMTKANLVMGKVDEALGQVGYGTAGVGGAVLGKVWGTPAVDLDETLDTIRANIGFNELAEMRQASPTGGALGQVAVRELELLTSALGSLNRRQSPPQLKRNLESIKAHYANWKAAVDEAAQPTDAAATDGGPQAGTVEDGYRFKGGDPSNPASWEKL